MQPGDRKDTPAPDEVAQPAQFPIGWDEMPPEDVLRAEAKVSGWMREHRITDWALGHSASRDMLNRLTARVAELEALVRAVPAGLENNSLFCDGPAWFATRKALLAGKEPTDA